jgi:hypothetical protein
MYFDVVLLNTLYILHTCHGVIQGGGSGYPFLGNGVGG